MVRYNYLVPIVAKPCFTFSYLGVSFIDFQKEKTPQSIEITAFLVRLPGLEPGASGLGGSRSILLSYRRIWFCRAVQCLKALYPLSHDAVKTSFFSGISRTFFRQKTLQSYPARDMFNLHGWISRKIE